MLVGRVNSDLTAVFADDANPGIDESRSDDGRIIGDEEGASEQTTVTRD